MRLAPRPAPRPPGPQAPRPTLPDLALGPFVLTPPCTAGSSGRAPLRRSPRTRSPHAPPTAAALPPRPPACAPRPHATDSNPPQDERAAIAPLSWAFVQLPPPALHCHKAAPPASTHRHLQPQPRSPPSLPGSAAPPSRHPSPGLRPAARECPLAAARTPPVRDAEALACARGAADPSAPARCSAAAHGPEKARRALGRPASRGGALGEDLAQGQRSIMGRLPRSGGRGRGCTAPGAAPGARAGAPRTGAWPAPARGWGRRSRACAGAGGKANPGVPRSRRRQPGADWARRGGARSGGAAGGARRLARGLKGAAAVVPARSVAPPRFNRPPPSAFAARRDRGARASVVRPRRGRVGARPASGRFLRDRRAHR
jgi:hypothetical protein